jgi:hypothetical protein
MIDGIWSKPVDHWPYIPICQEHLTESLVRTGTNRQNVISLADMRRRGLKNSTKQKAGT